MLCPSLTSLTGDATIYTYLSLCLTRSLSAVHVVLPLRLSLSLTMVQNQDSGIHCLLSFIIFFYPCHPTVSFVILSSTHVFLPVCIFVCPSTVSIDISVFSISVFFQHSNFRIKFSVSVLV